MRLLKKFYYAIALFSLRIPAIWAVLLTYSLFQVILLYLQSPCSLFPLTVVECAAKSPEDLVLLEKPFVIEAIKEKVPDMLSPEGIPQNPQDKPKNLNVSVDLKSDAVTVLSSALTAIGKTLETYVPVISGTAVAGGTAVITKSLPAKQRFAGMVIAGGITSGTMLASQYMNLVFKETNVKKEESKILSQINSLGVKPDWNTNTNAPGTVSSTPDTSYPINAPLEGFDNLSMMALGIIIINFFVVLGLLFILINYLISFLDLESKKFVTDRPLLLKFLKASAKSRNFMTKFVFLFIIFGTSSMFYFICYLLYFLKDLGL